MRRPFLFWPGESARAPDRGRSSTPARVRYRSFSPCQIMLNDRPCQIMLNGSRSAGRIRPPGSLAACRGPFPVTRCPWYVMRGPWFVGRGRRSPGRGPWPDPWPVTCSGVAVCHPDNVQLRCPLFVQALRAPAPIVRTCAPVFVHFFECLQSARAASIGPRAAALARFFPSRIKTLRGPGPKKRAGSSPSGANARFHTLD